MKVGGDKEEQISFTSFSSIITSLSYSFCFSSYFFFFTIAVLDLVYIRMTRHSVGPRDRLPRQLRILLDKNAKRRKPRLILAPLPRGPR